VNGDRDATEPAKGYAEKTAQWRAKLEAMQPPKSQNVKTSKNETAETPKPGNDPDQRTP